MFCEIYWTPLKKSLGWFKSKSVSVRFFEPTSCSYFGGTFFEENLRLWRFWVFLCSSFLLYVGYINQKNIFSRILDYSSKVFYPHFPKVFYPTVKSFLPPRRPFSLDLSTFLSWDKSHISSGSVNKNGGWRWGKKLFRGVKN